MTVIERVRAKEVCSAAYSPGVCVYIYIYTYIHIYNAVLGDVGYYREVGGT